MEVFIVIIFSKLPLQITRCLIFCDFGFKEVFLFSEVHDLAHPWKRIFITEEDREIDHLAATIHNMTNVLFY